MWQPGLWVRHGARWPVTTQISARRNALLACTASGEFCALTRSCSPSVATRSSLRPHPATGGSSARGAVHILDRSRSARSDPRVVVPGDDLLGGISPD